MILLKMCCAMAEFCAIWWVNWGYKVLVYSFIFKQVPCQFTQWLYSAQREMTANILVCKIIFSFHFFVELEDSLICNRRRACIHVGLFYFQDIGHKAVISNIVCWWLFSVFMAMSYLSLRYCNDLATINHAFGKHSGGGGLRAHWLANL